jgi:tetratricopeptide (TPR) repeat protein
MPGSSTSQDLQLAFQRHNEGQLQQAEELYQRILAEDPNHVDALQLLGVLAYQTGRHQIAVDLIGRAIALNPSVGVFHYNLGNALAELGLFDRAIEAFTTAVRLDPSLSAAESRLGDALFAVRKYPASIAAYQRALRAKPDSAEIYNNLGLALEHLHQYDQAETAYRRALQLDPSLPEVHNNLGHMRCGQRRYQESVDFCSAAIRLKPDFAGAYDNLGNALQMLERTDEAIAAYQAAIRIKPDFPRALSNLAYALKDQGRLDEAVQSCDKALAIDPNFIDAHINKAVTLLLTGDLARGFPELEWRWKWANFSAVLGQFPKPLWDGSDPAGRTILLHTEQGFGDTIQFIRYAKLIQNRGGRVVLSCQKELRSLLSRTPGVADVVATGEPLPAYDVHCPLLRIPMLMGTTLDTIPADVPYIFPDPDLVKHWSEKLAPNNARRKIGLVWGGNVEHVEAARRHPEAFKKQAALDVFAPLGAVGNLVFYSLQKGSAGRQAQSPPPGMTILDYTAELKDFGDTAALIANLDLVISVDTAVAHLAGAMARPTWTLLAYNADWRYFLKRSDSPWYPTMKLFRQPARGDWAGAVAQVVRELQE